MKTLLLPLLVLLPAACMAPQEKDYGRALPDGAAALLPLDADDEVPDIRPAFDDRERVLAALRQSLTWARRPHAAGRFPKAGITHERVLRTLEALEAELVLAEDREQLAAAIDRDFVWMKSAGWDGQGGGVLFTGYCTPILMGSLEPTAEFCWPLYALPDDLVKDANGLTLGIAEEGAVTGPYPDRDTIEAGFLAGRGLELVWLRDPVDALLAHVNGSAVVRLQDGSEARFGYAGKNGRPYTSIGRELVEDGHVDEDDISLLEIRRWAAANPASVDEMFDRNESFVFFQPIEGNPHGSLDVPVTAERSLATDKSIFPPAAPVFVLSTLPAPRGTSLPFEQLMFDQDTGGAIRTAGRADLYLGVGPSAEARAGATKEEGQLYYLFLREDRL